MGRLTIPSLGIASTPAVGGSTFLKMQNRVYAVLRDADKTFVLPSEVKDWLNDAQRDLSHRLKVLKGETVSSTSSATIALPAGFIEAISLRLGAADDVDWVDDEVFWSHQDAGSAPSRTLGRIFNGNIEVYPAPTASTAYTLRYYREPADLSVDADISALPTPLHERMVNFARAHGKWKQGEGGEGDRYYSLYEQGLPDPTLARTREMPGPFTVTFDPGPFDNVEVVV